MKILSVCIAGPVSWRLHEVGEEHCFTYHCPASWRGDLTDFGCPMLRVSNAASSSDSSFYFRKPLQYMCIYIYIYVHSRLVGGAVLAAYCMERARATRSLPIECQHRLGRRKPLELQTGELRSLRRGPGEYFWYRCVSNTFFRILLSSSYWKWKLFDKKNSHIRIFLISILIILK